MKMLMMISDLYCDLGCNTYSCFVSTSDRWKRLWITLVHYSSSGSWNGSITCRSLCRKSRCQNGTNPKCENYFSIIEFVWIRKLIDYELVIKFDFDSLLNSLLNDLNWVNENKNKNELMFVVISVVWYYIFWI
jgi:hypothetical protein